MANGKQSHLEMAERDEVDFISTKKQEQNIHNNNNNNNFNISTTTKTNYANVPKTKTTTKSKDTTEKPNKEQQQQQPQTHRLSLFSFGRSSSSSNSNHANSNKKLNSHKSAKTEKPAPLKASKSSPLLLPPTPPVPIGTPPRQHKFVKSSSIARLLGNTYNAKKFEKEEQKRLAANKQQTTVDGKFHTYGGRRRHGPYLERFKRVSKEDGDIAGNNEPVTVTGVLTMTHETREHGVTVGSNDMPGLVKHAPEQDLDLGAKAMRTLSRGLGKLWWKRTHSVDISTPDPEFKVSYLGNVLTGWAKGEGCVEKQLNTLWRNYTQNNKPDVIMRVKVCASGLKATTRQHGLTEYWANRITYCCAPKNYPRVVCWIYRHEGRKLKHELRCHAVLCSKEKIALDICETLKENLESALREFKREKILKQNARLSLANAVYDNPSLPRRKIMLSVGGNNYRPPLERSKSAPKLMAIEEAIGEEEGDEIEDTNEPEMKACCQKDSLYPAMTLGRRRCRRGHSIRRTGKAAYALNFGKIESKCCAKQTTSSMSLSSSCQMNTTKACSEATAAKITTNETADGSDSDDFEKLLKYNNYDANTTLSTELLPYFDMQLHKNTSQSLSSLSELQHLDDSEEPLSLLPTINSDPSANPASEFATITEQEAHHDDDDEAENMVNMRRSGVCSDGEEDYLDDTDDMYFRQAAILNMLHRNSMRKMANLSLSSDEQSSIETNASSAGAQYRHQAQSSISSTSSAASSNAGMAHSSAAQEAAAAAASGSNVTQRNVKQLNPDSDEGSISSGCETASTVTANQDDVSLKYRQLQQQLLTTAGCSLLNAEAEETEDLQDIYQRLESRHNSDTNSNTTYSSSSSITLKLSTSPATSLTGLADLGNGATTCNATMNGTNATANTMLQLQQQRTTKRTRKHSNTNSNREHNDDTDSDRSDESGYVEYQEQRKSLNGGGIVVVGVNSANNKPHPPPKPLPRRLLNNVAAANTNVSVSAVNAAAAAGTAV